MNGSGIAASIRSLGKRGLKTFALGWPLVPSYDRPWVAHPAPGAGQRGADFAARRAALAADRAWRHCARLLRGGSPPVAPGTLRHAGEVIAGPLRTFFPRLSSYSNQPIDKGGRADHVFERPAGGLRPLRRLFRGLDQRRGGHGPAVSGRGLSAGRPAFRAHSQGRHARLLRAAEGGRARPQGAAPRTSRSCASER